MTAELRNLPHIASMAFNEPLMLEPAYARVFFCALAGQLGISRLTDAVSGDSLTAGEAPAALALSVDDDGPRQARSYQVMNGIAVLPVSGTLVSRTRALQPYSGMTGYNGIIARLQQAASDPMVDGILLDMDTPGGMVAGAFDCADIIARVRDIKPVWALANDMNCSAGQLLASAASRRLVTQTARTGSIGVMMAHSNYGAALEKQGVEITLIYSGSHKVDGNPYSHLPDDVRETLQSRMDATRRMFAQKVSAYTGLSVQAVLDTEAAVYSGQEAIDAGLADELVNSTDAITVMRDALDARKSRLSGGRMTKETQSTTVSATASQADVTGVVQATEGENASAAQPDVNAQITAAVAAENSRIMGILNCEEAHGREEQACVLAETPGMGRSAANNITQSGGTEWSKRDKSTYDPTDDIEAYALNASGVVNIIVFDPKGWALFRSFKAVKEKLDTRRGSNSELETAVKDLGEAVSYKGMYGDTAIVVYSGQYVENDVKKNFLPDNTMVLGNTQARGLRTYGCIQDADAQREGINASARYPKNWVTTGDPAREFTMIQSAPLMLLADPDAFVSVQLA
ncbi:S49 family peptidase [Escherichia coli]|nr:S49 family peptidase [Escherichia coli]